MLWYKEESVTTLHTKKEAIERVKEMVEQWKISFPETQWEVITLEMQNYFTFIPKNG